jgi:hypothetical protein
MIGFLIAQIGGIAEQIANWLMRNIAMKEFVTYEAQWTIEKYKDGAIKPYETRNWHHNCLLNEGINELWTLVAGGSATAYSNANARLGVGNSNTAAQATDTALLGGSTCFKAMEAGYPTYGASQKITFKSSFGSSDGNFAWEEFTVDNGSSPNKNLNRYVSSKGTKSAGETWTLTLDITLS